MLPVLALDVGAAIKTLVLTLDLFGTFVFALSGAIAGARRRLDIFGVLVLSFVAANSGGIVRDLLIGATPPAAIRDWRYMAVSLLAGLVIFFWYPIVNRLRNPVLIFDGAGLALFCVAGAQKALVFGADPWAAALLGMLTGIGGGVARDVLLNDDQGRITIFAAGTGNPYFTTDTAAALRACEIGAECLLKATKVDGIYDKDPVSCPDAVRFERISHHEVLVRGLQVMDSTAAALCQDNRMPIIVLNIEGEDNIKRALMGEPVGTVVVQED